MARNDFSGTGTFNTDNVSYVGDDPTGIGYEEADVSFTPGVGYGSQNIDTGGQSTDGSSLSESGYQNAMGITPTNPFGYDNFFSRNFGVDPRNINYTQQYADAPGGAASYMKGLGNDKYTNTFANPRNLSSLPGYDSNQKEGVLREAITGAPFGSLFGNNAGVKTAFGEVAEQDREMPFGEAASRLGIGALNPLLGYGLSNLGTTEMKLKTDADYDFTKDPNDPRYISKGAFSGILDSVTGGGGSKVATTARDGLLGLADNVMNFFNKDGKAQAGGLETQFDQFGNVVGSSTFDNAGNSTDSLSEIQKQRNKNEYLQQNASEVGRLRESKNSMTEPSFMGKDNATINIEKLPLGVNLTREPTKFMDAGNSLATNPEGIAATSVNQNKDGYDLSLEGIKKVAAERFERAKSLAPGGADDIELTRRENLPRPPQLVSELQRDIAKRRGLFSLPEASGLDNNVISAGSQNGKPLSNSILQALNEQGFNLNIDEESLIDAPRRRFFDGTDEISVRDSNNGLTFANSLNRPFNTSDRISEVPSGPALTASQLRASEFDGFTLDPITGQAIYDERGPVQRLKIKDLPAEYQELVALNTELDYGDTVSVQDLINMSPRGIAQSNTALIKELEAQLKQREKEFNQRLSYETDSDTQGLPTLY